MAKIRITQPTYDKNTGDQYKVGDIIDLGGIRNKRAVETNQAQWVDSEKLAKAEANGENTENMTEKVEVLQGAKKTSTSARGKRIETKKLTDEEKDTLKDAQKIAVDKSKKD